MYFKKDKVIGNQRGYSLVIALISLAVLSILGVSIISISSNTSNAALIERTDQAVYYIAEAGLVEAKAQISKALTDKSTIPTNLHYSSETANPDFKRHMNMKTEADVTITNKDTQPTYDLYELISIGTIEGSGKATSRSVAQLLRVEKDGSIETCPITEMESGSAPSTCFNPGDPGDENSNPGDPGDGNDNPGDGGGTGLTGGKIHVFEEITINDNGNGNGVKIDKNIKISTGFPDNGKVNKNYKDYMIWNIPFSYQLPPFPNEKFNQSPSQTINLSGTNIELNLDKDIKIQNINTEKFKLTINVGSSDRAIYFGNLNLKQAEIEVIGSGKLTFYIDNMTIDNKVSIYRKDGQENLELFVKENANINHSADFNLKGSLYTQRITLDGKFDITGNLMISTSNDYPINSSADVRVKGIYSPNAHLLNGGKIKFEENIITKKLTLHSSTSISLVK